MQRKVIPSRWTEDRKGAGNKSSMSGVRSLEAESIRTLTATELVVPQH